MEILWFLIISYILLSISLYFVFPKAGREAWKGLVPGLNFIVWCDLIGRKRSHAVWLLVPIVNLFIFIGMAVDMVRSFGKYQFWHSAVAFLYAPLAFFYLGLSKDEKYLGPTLTAEQEFEEALAQAREKNDQKALRKLLNNNPYQKGPFREWAEAIVFAVFAAAFIRMFLIEAYTIPTSSMEGSLLVGDFLFVSKAHYGIRTPKTVVMVPLLHNRIPMLNRESYLAEPDIPFTRLPALESIDRNDPVVFNYPEGDSVYVFPERTYSIYDYRRGAITPQRARQIESGKAELVVRPIDKKDHYIKRCVATPGDTIQVIDRQLYVNGQPAKNPEHLQLTYLVTFPSPINTRNFEEWGISQEDIRDRGANYMILVLSEEQKEQIQSLDDQIEIVPNNMFILELPPGSDPANLREAGVKETNFRRILENGFLVTLSDRQIENIRSLDSTLVVRPLDESARLFPHDPQHFPNWNVDNYGPVWVPKAGSTVTLSPDNIALYRRIISVYEGNQLEEKGGKFFINGKEAESYTFRMDYFWMMGDNRHNSEDSRVWGFVPHDHVVGKPLFIWFSLREGSMAKGVNWGRIFSSASKM